MMQYRKFGNTGVSVSALGFGAMRLPLLPDNQVDEKESVRMIRYAIDQGVNYVDTAYPYLDGTSELIVGKALKDGYRDKTFLADKCPVWLVEKEEDFDRILEEQLGKLKVDTIDFYLLHALDRFRFEEKVKKFHLIDKMIEAKKQGKIKYLGFSFHDDYEVFKEIIDETDVWDFCQIQYNYINVDYQAGQKGLQYAAEQGLGVIIMEPLLGGKLANLTDHVAEVFPKNKTVVRHALDFIWDQPQVSLLLSGMSTMEQVELNLNYADASNVGMLSQEQKEAYKKAKEIYDSMALVPCTACGYCMPCPFGLNIPEIFSCYNMTATPEKGKAKENYRKFAVKADQCQACRHCEKECPQHIEISRVMTQVGKVFE